MNRHTIVHGRVCRHHNRVGADFVTSRRSNAGVFTTFDFVRMRSGKDSPAIAFNRAR